MPNYKKHLFAGFAVYTFLLYLLTSFHIKLVLALQYLFCCLLGSLFPDIDTKSKIQKLFYISLLILFIYLIFHNKINLLIILSFISLLPLIVDHRTIFHKTWFILLISIIIILFSKILLNIDCFISIIFFIAGALSHIFLDKGLKKSLKIKF